MVEIHEHFNLDPYEIAEGNFKDTISGKIYKASSSLNSMDLLRIANEAKSMSYMDGYVNWLIAALKKAKIEKLDSKSIKSIKYV